MAMHRGICKECGGAFWETYKGARGEDLCDRHLDPVEDHLRAEDLNGALEDEGFGGLDMCDPEDTMTGDW